MKDYFLCQAKQGNKMQIFWCSSSSWVFSQLPEACTDADTIKKLKSINNLFTGEFDSILFPGAGPAKIIDHEMDIKMQPKPITELDRLAYIVSELKCNFAVPKGQMKYTPSGCIEYNEGFKGLSKDDSISLDNWQFSRTPCDEEILSLIARDEATYNVNCLDSVAKDFPKNAWSIQ